MRFLILPVLLFLIQCSSPKEYEFIIDRPTEERLITISLDTVYAKQSIVVLTNTLDDTCKLGQMKISPNRTGKLYDIEFFRDSISYRYYPYKATKGQLVFKHVFY